MLTRVYYYYLLHESKKQQNLIILFISIVKAQIEEIIQFDAVLVDLCY